MCCMLHTKSGRRGRPKLDKPENERLERKEILLSREMIAAIDAKARETETRDGRAYSFSEALRDIVGAWMQREGSK